MRKEIVTGRIARDCEVKQIKDATYISFVINAEDKKDNPADWVNILIRTSGAAGTLQNYLKKGASVTVLGRISAHVYNKKDGTPAIDTTVWSESFTINAFARDQEEAAPAPAPAPAPAEPQYHTGASRLKKEAQVEEEPTDLPF